MAGTKREYRCADCKLHECTNGCMTIRKCDGACPKGEKHCDQTIKNCKLFQKECLTNI